VLRTLTIRLYPNCAQSQRLEHYLFVGRLCFNRALEARIHWYRTTGKSLSCYDQYKDLTVLRAADQFWEDVPVQVERDAIRRLDIGFKAFFRRVKTGEKPGFPRFKSRNRWSSFTIQQCGQVVRNGRIRVRGIPGTIRCRNLQQFDGKIIEQCVLCKAGKWFCHLVVELAKPQPVLHTGPRIGIDVGLSKFAAFSDGTIIENPRFARRAARQLAHAHRHVSRRKKGSKNRSKAVMRLQRVYVRTANLRHNFTHQLSRSVVNKHGVIAVEDLNIKGMVKGRFGKSIMDAAWGQFTSQLEYKAEEAGSQFAKVNPRGTSQDCSQCGQTVPKDLSVRVHRCPDCGLVLDRDVNAARNILARAFQTQHPAAVGRSVMPAEGRVAAPTKQEVLT
jgi:putative transposase